VRPCGTDFRKPVAYDRLGEFTSGRLGGLGNLVSRSEVGEHRVPPRLIIRIAVRDKRNPASVRVGADRFVRNREVTKVGYIGTRTKARRLKCFFFFIERIEIGSRCVAKRSPEAGGTNLSQPSEPSTKYNSISRDDRRQSPGRTGRCAAVTKVE